METRAMGQFELAMLGDGELYAWKHDLASAAFCAAETLTGIVTLNTDLMPSPSGLYVFERELRFAGCKHPLSGIGWESFGADMTAIFMYNSSAFGGAMLAFSGFLIKNNHDCAIAGGEIARCSFEEIESTPGRNVAAFDARRKGTNAEFDPSVGTPSVVRFLVASWLWLKQRVMTSQSGLANGTATKQAERLGLRSSVNVVLLRRSEQSRGVDSGHDAVEWSCQWFVRGHWRQQYLPSTHSHRPLWIEPYVKGPEDKPLRLPTQTVYQVSR